MNQYRCETCKNYEDDDGKSACNIREEWISTDVWNWIKVVGCASHSDFQSERDKVLEALKKDLQTRIISSSNQWSKGRNSGLLECCNIIDELRQAGKP